MSSFIQDYLDEPPPMGKNMVLLIWAPYNPDNAEAEAVHQLFRSTAAAAAADDHYQAISFGRMQVGKVCCCGTFSVDVLPTVMLVDEKGTVVERLVGMGNITKTALDDAVSRLVLLRDGDEATKDSATDQQHCSQSPTGRCMYHRGVKKSPFELFLFDNDDTTNNHGMPGSMHQAPFSFAPSRRGRFHARRRNLAVTKPKRNPSVNVDVDDDDDDDEQRHQDYLEFKPFMTRHLRESKPHHAEVMNDAKIPSTDESFVGEMETRDSGSEATHVDNLFDPPNDNGRDHTVDPGDVAKPSFAFKTSPSHASSASTPKSTYSILSRGTLYLMAVALACGGTLGVMILERDGGDPLTRHKAIFLVSFLVIMAIFVCGNHHTARAAPGAAKLHTEADGSVVGDEPREWV